MLTAGGDSDHPEQVRQAILDRAKALLQEGLSQEDFLRMKRSAIGRRVRGMDSFDNLCFRLCAYHFSGFDFFELPGLYTQITKEDILNFIQSAVTEDSCNLSVIDPL